MESRPPVFATLPEVASIEPAEAEDTYRVTLRESDGHAESVLMTVTGGPDGTLLVSSDWDVFWRWPGDAASVRAVCAQVTAFHRRRRP